MAEHKKKIVFFGTPDLAAEILMLLSRSDVFSISAVVTAPDAPVGRGQKIQPSPVKKKAQELGITSMYTPEKLTGTFAKQLKKKKPDIFVVVAYGLLFPDIFLSIPTFGAFNLHFSLLPKYRGASPVQSAILHGDKISGFSVFRLVEKMDAGPVYIQEPIRISQKNAAEVFAEMTKKGGQALLRFCEDICQGEKFLPLQQSEKEATYCTKIKKQDGQIFPWRENSEQILRKHRAFFLWPQVFLFPPNTKERIVLPELMEWSGAIPKSSTLFFKSGKKCGLRSKDGAVEIVSAKPAGKAAMTGLDFYNWWRQQK